MNKTVFCNARIFDGVSGALTDGHVLVEGNRIGRVTTADLEEADAQVIDAAGRVLMPGLIDLHVHIWFAEMNVTELVNKPLSYMGLFAAKFLESSLLRGFTSLRDAGGTDPGFAMGIAKGFIPSPRFFFSGRYISQTGGHGDFRNAFAPDARDCYCCPPPLSRFTQLADGPHEVRRAVREEFRRGAQAIKIMASGGVASPTDPVHQLQFTDEEIAAAVDEAGRHDSYVFAHCHPDAAIRRCAELGVRCIEHVTEISRETAELLASKGTYAVPTVSVVKALTDDGAGLGMPDEILAKLGGQFGSIMKGLVHLEEAGVKTGFGTDLLAQTHDRQSREFELRGRVLPALSILRSATSIAAEILMEEGNLGIIAEGALADIILVDGNPLDDINVLAQDGRTIPFIMKDGEIVKNLLCARPPSDGQ